MKTAQTSPLTNLNPEQIQAVTTTEGRVLVLAGAGTGKTLVLTKRIAYLICEKKVPPSAILGLTFTNKAAQEMHCRVREFVDHKASKQITLCTFHSFCIKVLRQEIHRLGYTSHFTIYQPSDVERLVKSIAKELLSHENELPSLKNTMALIAKAKNLGITPEELPFEGSKWHHNFTIDLYKRLMESMRAHNALDFDHMLHLTVELFTKFPEVLEKYHDRYQYIMIDEYQDTNPVQYKLASLLSQKHQNLCVVGDDDQSIYGWRGAEVKNILDFDQATVIKLEQNYRSTPTILQAANAVIQNNASRHGKSLWSKYDKGQPIEIFHAPSDIYEAEAVVYRIAALRKSQGLRWKDFAILYRSNALSRHFEQVLLKTSWHDGFRSIRGIPYQVFGGLEFFERREVKDVFSYLRVITNPHDQIALLRIINLPRRGIGGQCLDILTQYNRRFSLPLWNVLEQIANNQLPELEQQLSSQAKKGIQCFITLMQNAKQSFDRNPLSEALKDLIETINYKQVIKEDVKSQKMREFKWENVQELVSSLSEFENQVSAQGEKPSLSEYVTSSVLLETEQEKTKQKELHTDAVTLMTFHSAKGLEFPVCFLVGLEDHIIPHEKSMLETGIEEERRLMYVALTRAKERLYLCMAQKRNRMGKITPSNPSRFLKEIRRDLLSITQWDRIEES